MYLPMILINYGEDDILWPTDKKPMKGDFLRIDLYSKYKQYYGDVARSVVFGNPTLKVQKLYDAIRTAHDKTINMIELGVKCSEIYNTTKTSLRESGYDFKAPLVGHGTGICVHEAPYLGDNDMVIETGMAFTVEILHQMGPSSWLGIEDMVVCDRQGCRDITTITKDLTQI
jgi:Xaa-Pro aminopeptidase